VLLYQLYKYDKNNKNNTEVFNISNNNLKLVISKISLFNLLRSNHFVVDLYWLINTKGNCWVYSVYDEAKEIHHSYVTNKCYKFPFMKKEDIQISNGFTDEDYRGYGIYTFIMHKIVFDYLANNNGDIYGLVEQENVIPQKQLMKVGFVKTDEIVTEKIFGVLKIYHTASFIS